MKNCPEESASYLGAGVDVEREEKVLSRLIETATQTFAFVQGVGKPVLPIGFFANIIDIGHGMGLALSTDGVGTKLMVAQMMQKYDTVGDRKSTRLNSSHHSISYAVFCLKKKKQ